MAPPASHVAVAVSQLRPPLSAVRKHRPELRVVNGGHCSAEAEAGAGDVTRGTGAALHCHSTMAEHTPRVAHAHVTDEHYSAGHARYVKVTTTSSASGGVTLPAPTFSVSVPPANGSR